MIGINFCESFLNVIMNWILIYYQEKKVDFSSVRRNEWYNIRVGPMSLGFNSSDRLSLTSFAFRCKPWVWIVPLAIDWLNRWPLWFQSNGLQYCSLAYDWIILILWFSGYLRRNYLFLNHCTYCYYI